MVDKRGLEPGGKEQPEQAALVADDGVQRMAAIAHDTHDTHDVHDVHQFVQSPLLCHVTKFQLHPNLNNIHTDR